MRQRNPMRCLSWRSSRQIELGAELGLTDEQDLQDLLVRRLEVGEEPDLLEGVRIEILGLVEDQDGVLAGALALDEEILKREKPLGRRCFPRLADAEVLQEVLEDPVEVEHRIGDERDGGRLVQSFEQCLEQGSLAGSHLAGQQDEALALLYSVQELGERLSVRWRQMEKPGIGRRIERRLLKPEEGEVHGHEARSRSSMRTSCSFP